MKNKKTIYFLLPLVIVIWAMIIYRVLSGLSPDQPTEKKYRSPKPTVFAVDTFQYALLPEYRDPFFTSHEEIKKTPKKIKKKVLVKKKAKAPKKKSQVDWSQIKYFGMVQNPKTKKQMALMVIKGAYHYVEPDMKILDFEIQNIYEDSIGMLSQGETKFFYKK